MNTVSADVDRLLGPKSLDQLRTLELQVNQKLQSNEPIDVEYWEQLLDNIGVYKAKAQLRRVYTAVINARLAILAHRQVAEAHKVQAQFVSNSNATGELAGASSIPYSGTFDPDPLLQINQEDKALEVIDESEFSNRIVSYCSGAAKP